MTTAEMPAEMPNETHDWDAVAERLRKRLDEGFPAAWLPEKPDDELIGRVVRVTMQAPTQYGPAPVVQVELAGGTRYSLWLTHKVLRQLFERERVRIGEVVAVRYLGERHPAAGGNPYAMWSLAVDRPLTDEEPDWDGMARLYDDQQVSTSPPPEVDADFAAAADDDIPF